MRNFIIFTNTDKDPGYELSNKIVDYLVAHDAKAMIITEQVRESFQQKDANVLPKELLSDVDAAIVLGGDGTMLRAARDLGGYPTPLVGINLGTLGFLTEIEVSNVYQALDRLLADDYFVEKRMMIEGAVNGDTYHALNDIVISRAGFSRIIGLNIYVNDELLETYEADGVIVATPTGSTGYNLSAGGPIISPKSKAIVVTPISPHSLMAKSVVFDSTDEVRIEIVKKRKTQDTEAIVSFDGSDNAGLSAGDSVTAKMSSREITLIKMYDVNFYKILRDKIGG
ncbi:MAG: NAD(+)/NADH kinase [Lachnospiraceae bacterium]|nr:NAD(+)/NADH kinase [Lachnospiraceae bacterium]